MAHFFRQQAIARFFPHHRPNSKTNLPTQGLKPVGRLQQSLWKRAASTANLTELAMESLPDPTRRWAQDLK